ncbi:MAG: hypothetical protein SCK57_02610 [Bacillota bacterium]|nr:hypothetical protein [Bacillota bacterium]MDW7676532.1 hypothetical protein [Bacillota bacterium]
MNVLPPHRKPGLTNPAMYAFLQLIVSTTKIMLVLMVAISFVVYLVNPPASYSFFSHRTVSNTTEFLIENETQVLTPLGSPEMDAPPAAADEGASEDEPFETPGEAGTEGTIGETGESVQAEPEEVPAEEPGSTDGHDDGAEGSEASGPENPVAAETGETALEDGI